MIYTFWENKMPDYIRLCLDTWAFPYVMLNYDNLDQYTELPIDKLKRFALPQIADVVRVHILRDHGGYWLDADTIMNGTKLPRTMFVGDNESRYNTIGYLYAEKPHLPTFEEWAQYQDAILDGEEASHYWALMANAFTDPYLKDHTEIEIGNIFDHWLETDNWDDRQKKYVNYYFIGTHTPEIPPMLMLHNQWTPKWYKRLTRSEVLAQDCTLSHILRQTIKK